MTAVVLRGDARRLPLPDASVDLIVTSPPYFGLRSYTDGGEHYENQIGSEATPGEWVAALVECTREWMRVLKPSGSLFVNLGDKYAGSDANGKPHTGSLSVLGRGGGKARESGALVYEGSRAAPGRPKSLLGLPWRYALACMDELGLILRRDIIWSKPNGLPESVTDRCRSSHEYVFHLTRQPRYYAAVDEIREESATADHRLRYPMAKYADTTRQSALRDSRHNNSTFTTGPNPLGKLPGSVWEIPSQPLTVPPELGVDHFAAFPMELPRRCILGWSPPGVCTTCNEGRRPVRGVDWAKVPHTMTEKRALTETERLRFAELFCEWQQARGLSGKEIAGLFPSRTGGLTGCVANWRAGANVLTPEQADAIEAEYGPLPAELLELVNLMRLVPVAEIEDGSGNILTGRHNRRAKSMTFGEYGAITGYACGCPDATAPTRPAVVVDPFGGTGTTALVASMHGRIGVSVDLSGDYCRLAAWRTTDPAERAKALQVPKPPPTPEGQMDLFTYGLIHAAEGVTDGESSLFDEAS